MEKFNDNVIEMSFNQGYIKKKVLDSILPCVNRLLPSVNRSLNTDEGL